MAITIQRARLLWRMRFLASTQSIPNLRCKRQRVRFKITGEAALPGREGRRQASPTNLKAEEGAMTVGWSLIVMLLGWWPAALNPAGPLVSQNSPADEVLLTGQAEEIQRQARLLGQSV